MRTTNENNEKIELEKDNKTSEEITQKQEELLNMNDESNEPLINYYYLFYFLF